MYEKNPTSTPSPYILRGGGLAKHHFRLCNFVHRETWFLHVSAFYSIYHIKIKKDLRTSLGETFGPSWPLEVSILVGL